MYKILRICAAASLSLLACVAPAQATTYTSSRVDVALQATVANGLSATIAVPAVAFGVVSTGAANTPPVAQAISIVSVWNLGVGQTVKMYAFFDSASAAMTGTLNGQTIPTSALTASVNAGSSQAFTSASPFTSGSTSTTVYSVLVTSANAVTTRTDSVMLTLTPSASLMADTYTGTLHFQAQAI